MHHHRRPVGGRRAVRVTVGGYFEDGRAVLKRRFRTPVAGEVEPADLREVEPADLREVESGDRRRVLQVTAHGGIDKLRRRRGCRSGGIGSRVIGKTFRTISTGRVLGEGTRFIARRATTVQRLAG